VYAVGVPKKTTVISCMQNGVPNGTPFFCALFHTENEKGGIALFTQSDTALFIIYLLKINLTYQLHAGTCVHFRNFHLRPSVELEVDNKPCRAVQYIRRKRHRNNRRTAVVIRFAVVRHRQDAVFNHYLEGMSFRAIEREGLTANRNLTVAARNGKQTEIYFVVSIVIESVQRNDTVVVTRVELHHMHVSFIRSIILGMMTAPTRLDTFAAIRRAVRDLR